MIDNCETPNEAAIRELKEETGLIAKEVHDYGYIFSSPGSTSEKIYLFIIFCEDSANFEQHLDFSEDIKVELFTVDEVNNLMFNNQLNHSATQVLFCRYLMQL